MPRAQKIVEKLRRRVIKNFMDILLLAELRKNPMSGYDVIKTVHDRFGILLSSGTVYSKIYSMERDGLIKGAENQRKRVYTLTEKGEQNAEVIMNARSEMQSLLRNVTAPKD